MKNILAVVKPYLRWFILGGTLFFLLKTFKAHWQEVAAVRIDTWGWLMLTVATSITFLAHIWSGWVWSWILKAFRQPCRQLWAIRVYLITNLAKYLPGNIWHFYGRITAVSQAGGSFGAATLSVLLEPLLMAVAALIVALICTGLGWLETNSDLRIWGLQIFFLGTILVGIHPRILNPVMHQLSRIKGNAKETKTLDGRNKPSLQATGTRPHLDSYPILPLVGAIGFLLFKGIGFLLTIIALQSVVPEQIPQLLGTFSLAWVIGLIVPGAPGGMGVFEAVAIALLDHSQFSAAIILTAVALFRLISILAETLAAGLAWSFKLK
ncbi:UPF0104 family protein [Pleurocapsales cyanobacterium LEGE 06147]|nr:UPF0104 family protein [Pleurocapsales cyanobacterium LEGE 06147]